MTSSRPYLIRAIYEWLLDNELTPYIMVDATYPEVAVPDKYIEEGKIILNITPMAVGNMAMGNTVLEFDARFSGVPYHIYIPIKAVAAIYAYENGRGMVFNEHDDDDDGGDVPPDDRQGRPDQSKAKRPHLRVVK